MSEQNIFSCKDYKKVFSDFTLHVLLLSGRMGGDFKKNGFCGELGEKKCLPLPMNRVIFFKITDDVHLD